MSDVQRITGLALALRKQANLDHTVYGAAVGAGLGGLGGAAYSYVTNPLFDKDRRRGRILDNTVSGALMGGVAGGLINPILEDRQNTIEGLRNDKSDLQDSKLNLQKDNRVLQRMTDIQHAKDMRYMIDGSYDLPQDLTPRQQRERIEVLDWLDNKYPRHQEDHIGLQNIYYRYEDAAPQNVQPDVKQLDKLIRQEKLDYLRDYMFKGQ